MDYSNSEVLKYALDNGMIDLSYVQGMMEMNKRKEILEKHQYQIWQGKDQKWYTYISDDKNGRKLVKRNARLAIDDYLVEFYKAKSENPTIKEVFEEWNNRRLELGKILEATHLRNKQVFNRHYKEFGNRKIKSLKAEELADFLEEQIPEYNLTAKAFSNLKTITRGFLKRAKKCKYISFKI